MVWVYMVSNFIPYKPKSKLKYTKTNLYRDHSDQEHIQLSIKNYLLEKSDLSITI